MNPLAPRRSDSASGGADVELLYGIEEAQAPRSGMPRWLRVLSTTVFLSVAAYSVMFAADKLLPFVVVFTVCAAGVLAWEATRATTEPPWLRVGQLVRPVHVRRRHDPGSWYEGGDGMVEAVRRWDRRLDWGIGGDRFVRTVGGRLGQLVDERLRQRHGLTRATDPDRARALVGERVWALLGPLDRPPTHRQVMAALDDLEQI